MTQVSLSTLLGPADQRWKGGPVVRRPCHPTGGDGDAVRRMAPLMVGQLPQTLTPTLEARHIRRPLPGLCPNIGTTGDAPLAWSPAAQRKLRLAGSLLGGTAAATRPARGPSAAPAATCPDKAWDVQHQSCLETTRDYATVSSKSPCLNLNLGARHFVPQCCLPSVSIFFCPFTDDDRPRPCLAVFERHATTSGGRFALVARYLESGI